MLQLRNSLYRQKRIRMNNERTSNAANERYDRAEGLGVEMRADLKSLKHRLDEELNKLGELCGTMVLAGDLSSSTNVNLPNALAIVGIEEESAEKILSRFYRGQDTETGEASPLKVGLQ